MQCIPAATLYGVGVITKLYFTIIFAAFKESETLYFAQRSSKAIDFGTNRKRLHIFLLVVNSNLDPILHRFRDTVYGGLNVENRKSVIFPTPLLFRLKFGGVPFGVDPSF